MSSHAFSTLARHKLPGQRAIRHFMSSHRPWRRARSTGGCMARERCCMVPAHLARGGAVGPQRGGGAARRAPYWSSDLTIWRGEHNKTRELVDSVSAIDSNRASHIRRGQSVYTDDHHACRQERGLWTSYGSLSPSRRSRRTRTALVPSTARSPMGCSTSTSRSSTRTGLPRS